MTLEELKKEADALGYKLTKKTEPVHHMRCKCGGHGQVWYKGKEMIVKCAKCDIEAEYHKTTRQAWQSWNEMQSKED